MPRPDRVSLALTLALAAPVAAGCSNPSAPRDTPAPVPAAAEPAPPAPSQTGEGEARRIVQRGDVSLTGFRVDARPGDWLLENAGKVAVVDAHGGRVVDFGSAGHDDALVAIEPAVYIGFDDLRAEVVAVGPVPGTPRVLRIERRVHDAPLTLWTFVSFAGPALRIESVATTTSDATSTVTIGEKVGWGNVPTWVQGAGFVTQGGAFGGDFLAREGLGEA